MSNNIMPPIDFVVTWVDETDPNWVKQKNIFIEQCDKRLNKEARYRDWGFFKYWFRSVEKYAPWVNKIFLITEGHLPQWLNIHHPKLVHIRHCDYISAEFLPTFNSNVIELNLANIDELSEHFVLFNDDMFINAPVQQTDFFAGGGGTPSSREIFVNYI